MNWRCEQTVRKARAKDIERKIRALKRELKSVGHTDAIYIIGEDLAEKLNLHFRTLGYNHLGFFSRNQNGYYHVDPDYDFDLMEKNNTLYYFDEKQKEELPVPDDTSDICELLLSNRLGLYPRETTLFCYKE